MSINRRHVLGAALAVSATSGLWLPPVGRAQGLSLSTIPVAPFVEADTAAGRVRGGSCRGALSFKGIPYGGSLSGAHRFKAPPPVEPWKGVFDATRLGAPAIQGPKQTYGEQEPAYSEDCLVLNVWTPAVGDHGKRPVLFYCHGGGFVSGSAGSTTQDGAHMAATYDMVVVACNHRLGLMGYLYLGELAGGDYAANAGMLDVVAALQWVKANIAGFGGDPDNVTVLGESGGGGKVATLMAMPQAAGLFHKAGIQSGAWLRRMPKDRATETARRVLKALNLSDPAALAEVPTQTLLDLQMAGDKGPLGQPSDGSARPPSSPLMSYAGSDGELAGNFAPVVDGVVLPRYPYDPDATPLSANIPLMIANNREESAFGFLGQPEVFAMTEAMLTSRLSHDFGDRAGKIEAVYRRVRPGATPAELYIAATTARQFGNDTVTLADRKSAQAAPVYRYRWDYPSNFPVANSHATLGAGHATDIGCTFYNYDERGLHGNGPGVQQASANLSALWASFARSGVPSAPGVPAFPRYDTMTRATMLVNVKCQVVNDPDAEARKLWQSYSG